MCRLDAASHCVHDTMNHGLVDCPNRPLMSVSQGQGETDLMSKGTRTVLMGLQPGEVFFPPSHGVKVGWERWAELLSEITYA